MAARLVKGAFLRFWGRADDYSALLYLNDFAAGGGGQVMTASSHSSHPASSKSEPGGGLQTSFPFAEAAGERGGAAVAAGAAGGGVRVRPHRGAAIMWPNCARPPLDRTPGPDPGSLVDGRDGLENKAPCQLFSA